MKATLITLSTIALMLGGSDITAHQRGSYRFTLIASGAPYSFSTVASLNNRGTVSFIARTSVGEPGVFTGKGGPLTLLANGNGPFGGFGAWFTAINDSGTVAFRGDLIAGGIGMFTATRREITEIGGGAFSSLSLRPSINNAGLVTFLGGTAAVPYGLFAGRDGTYFTLYDSRPPSPFFSFGGPAINESGTVAFLAGVRETPSWAGIFTGNGGPTLTIADSRNGYLRLDTEPSINDAGAVAFAAILTSGVSGIFVGNGVASSTIADSSGPFNNFWISSPIINNRGAVVFFAELDGGRVGIFTGPDPQADKVIAVGDYLMGSVVTEFFLNGSRLGFNDRGQIVFVARLADGRDVVVRATPVRTDST
jgi:hypothetical protein